MVILYFCTGRNFSLSPLEGKLRTRQSSLTTSFMVALYKCKVLYCTGILISAKHVLTVSQCLLAFFDIIKPDFSEYKARISNLFLINDDKSVWYGFSEVKIHKEYDLRTHALTHNLGVITVNFPTDLNKRQK